MLIRSAIFLATFGTKFQLKARATALCKYYLIEYILHHWPCQSAVFLLHSGGYTPILPGCQHK
jgi:hypothetical protein